MSTAYRIDIDSRLVTYCSKVLPEALNIYSTEAMYGKEACGTEYIVGRLLQLEVGVSIFKEFSLHSSWQ